MQYDDAQRPRFGDSGGVAAAGLLMGLWEPGEGLSVLSGLPATVQVLFVTSLGLTLRFLGRLYRRGCFLPSFSLDNG